MMAKRQRIHSDKAREIPTKDIAEIVAGLRTLAAAEFSIERAEVRDLALLIGQRLGPINGRLTMREEGDQIIRHQLDDDERPLAALIGATLDLLLSIELQSAPADCGAKLRALADKLESQADGAHEPEPPANVDAPLSVKQLSKANDVPYDALRKRLDRLSSDQLERRIENANPRRGEPRYLYPVCLAMPIIEEMKRTGKTSVPRPSKKIS